MSRSRKGVYIASDCIISSLGMGTEANVAAISEGTSGIMKCQEGPLAAAVPDGTLMCGRISENIVQELRGKYSDSLTRAEHLAVAAVDGLGLDPKDGPAAVDGLGIEAKVNPSAVRRAFILSTTKGNVDLLEQFVMSGSNGELPEDAFLAEAARRIAARYGLENDCYVISNACISGVSALVVGKRMIEYGIYDEVIVAGVDVLSPFIVSGFASFRSLSPELCRPYDASRCGLNLGEAAGAVLLTSVPSEGAVVLSGGAISDDANHISGPSRTGDALYFAVRDAMSDAAVDNDDISFVNLHGTATAYNDEMESKAIALAGLSDKPAQSLKPYIGHTLGASGVVETILCAQQLLRGEIWGTPGFSAPGTPMPLNVSSAMRHLDMKYCVKTASGFGGCNAAVVLGLQSVQKELPEVRLADVELLKKVRLDNSDAVEKGFGDDFASYIRNEYKALGTNNMKFYKMDDLSKLGYVASHLLADGIEFGPEEMAVILQNRSASLDTDLRHQENISKGPGASPAVFVYTLPNVASGEISISLGIKGENTFFISPEYDRKRLAEYAGIVLSRTKARYCILGWLEFLGGKFEASLELLERK
ncbi:MAG: beta-ACP synthase [Bacteroidales bacterium]|nr:beta-ACP synthase [Bacteroidales bacterium]